MSPNRTRYTHYDADGWIVEVDLIDGYPADYWRHQDYLEDCGMDDMRTDFADSCLGEQRSDGDE